MPALAYLLFFVSGACALVYQVTWSRILGQLFGTTAHAVTTVLAAFLGGLALGSWALGRLADRTRRPLRLYGWLELGVAGAAWLSLGLFAALEPVYLGVARWLGPQSGGSLAVIFATAGAVILAPTFLMGGTLPVLSRFFVRRLERVGSELSLLYALNTFGAVVGALGAGFVLLRELGIHGTLYAAAAANAGVGLTSLWLSRRLEGGEATASALAAEPAVAPARSAPAAGSDPGAAGSDRAAGLALVFGLSGAASLGYEVLWARGLVTVIGGATYSFVVMLAAFLTGIALGSALVRGRLDAVASPRSLFGWIQLGIALAALATLPLLESISSVERGPSWFDGLDRGALQGMALRFALAFAVMLVPATLIGMTFPVAGRIRARALGALGSEIGGIYAANTAGNVVGALAAGFALLPLLGVHRSIALLCFANLAGAVWGLGGRGLRRLAPVAAAAALAIFSLVSEPARFAAEGQQASSPVFFYDEGVGATVSVLHMRGRADDRVMSVDGVVIGATLGDIHQKQQELAHLPFLLAPGLERGLTIGLGSGILLAEMARHSELRSVRCVEIWPGVVAGAALFAEHTGDVLANPKVELIVDDGVRHLRHTPDLYDVIVSDAKSQPQHAGNSAFLSRDFYEDALAHLRPGGLFVQWVPLHVPPPEYEVALRTFLAAFPFAWVWISPPSASFLIGAREPLRLDPERIDAALREPAFRGMRRLGWKDGAGVLSFLSADGPALAPLLGAGALNTLERPVLEFFSLRDYDVPAALRQAQNRALLLRARAGFGAAAGGLLEALGPSGRAATAFLEVDWYGGGVAAQSHLEEALRLAPESPTLRHLAARALQSRALALLSETSANAAPEASRAEQAEALLRQARQLAPGDFELQLALGEAAAEQVGQSTLRSLESVVRAREGWVELPLLLAGDLQAKGRLVDAAGFLRQALAADPQNVDARAALGFLLVASPARAELADAATGQRLLAEAYRAEPENFSVLNNYAISVFLSGDAERARALIDHAVALAPENTGLRRTQRQIYERTP